MLRKGALEYMQQTQKADDSFRIKNGGEIKEKEAMALRIGCNYHFCGVVMNIALR